MGLCDVELDPVNMYLSHVKCEYEELNSFLCLFFYSFLERLFSVMSISEQERHRLLDFERKSLCEKTETNVTAFEVNYFVS